ncbi:MAG: hypothetical protein SNI51_04205 [Rikenellaceae bacterium]
MKLFSSISAISLFALTLTACSSSNDTGEGNNEEAAFVYESWDNDFYTPTDEELAEPTTDIVADYGAACDASEDISSLLQQAIDQVSASGGGIITFPQGEYLFRDIEMRSGVKLHIDHNVTLHPNYNTTSRISMFEFGMDQDGDNYIEDAAIIGIGGRFKMILVEQSDNAKAIRPFFFRAVKGFTVANIHIEDVKTQLPMLAFGPTEDGELLGATDGRIMCISANNCHYGYGVVQAQCALDCHFEKLSGVGGVTMRLETGEEDMNSAQRGGVFDITADRIYCHSGNSAAMASPHSMQNGSVSFSNIVADACGFAIRVDGGYVSSKYEGDLAAGAFVSVTVDGVMSRYGETAQVKSKHFGYYIPSSLQYLCPAGDENDVSEPCPSVAAVVNEANYPSSVENVVAIGYAGPDILYEEP